MGKSTESETKQSQANEPQRPESPLELKVTLVRKSEDAYDVLGPDGKRLRCKCGRPVQASLHNVSVAERLEPCSKVIPELKRQRLNEPVECNS